MQHKTMRYWMVVLAALHASGCATDNAGVIASAFRQHPESVLVAKNGLVVGVERHDIIGLDQSTGQVRWTNSLNSIPLPNNIERENGPWDGCGPIQTARGLLVTDGMVIAMLDPVDGHIIWHATPDVYVEKIALTDDRIVVADDWRYAIIDLATGKVLLDSRGILLWDGRSVGVAEYDTTRLEVRDAWMDAHREDRFKKGNVEKRNDDQGLLDTYRVSKITLLPLKPVVVDVSAEHYQNFCVTAGGLAFLDNRAQGKICAFDSRDGKKFWDVSYEKLGIITIPWMREVEGGVLVGEFRKEPGEITSIDREGRIRWRSKVRRYYGVKITKSAAIIFAEGGSAYSIDLSNGKLSEQKPFYKWHDRFGN